MCVCMLLFYPGSTNPFTHTNTIEIGDDTSMSSSRFLIYDKTTIRKRFNFNLSIQHTFWFYSVLIIFHLDPQTHQLCLCSLFNVILKCKMLKSNIAVRMVGLSLTLPMHACVSSNRNMIKIRKISPHWWIFHSTALYIRPILWLDIHGCYWMLFANASLMNFTSNDESVSFFGWNWSDSACKFLKMAEQERSTTELTVWSGTRKGLWTRNEPKKEREIERPVRKEMSWNSYDILRDHTWINSLNKCMYWFIEWPRKSLQLLFIHSNTE